MYYFILRNALYNTSTKDIEINFKANTFREYIEFFLLLLNVLGTNSIVY